MRVKLPVQGHADNDLSYLFALVMKKTRHPSLEQTPTHLLPRFTVTGVNSRAVSTSPGELTPNYVNKLQGAHPIPPDGNQILPRRRYTPSRGDRHLSVVFSGVDLDTTINTSWKPASNSIPENAQSCGSDRPRFAVTKPPRRSRKTRRASACETGSSAEASATPGTGNSTYNRATTSSCRDGNLNEIAHRIGNQTPPTPTSNESSSRKKIRSKVRDLFHGSVLLTSNYDVSSEDTAASQSVNLSGATVNQDQKPGLVGRFVVLKAAVSNVNESVARGESSKQPNGQDGDSQYWSFTLDDYSSTPSAPDSLPLPGSTYWTVTSAQSARNSGSVVLTAPGAQTMRKQEHGRSPGTSCNRAGSIHLTPDTPQVSSPRGGTPTPTAASGQSGRPVSQSVQHRFRKFFVENFNNSRTRTHSEQQTLGTVHGQNQVGKPISLLPDAGTLPLHAHTITAGTGQSLMKGLLGPISVRTKDDAALSVSSISRRSSPQSQKFHGYPSSSVSSVSESVTTSQSGKDSYLKTATLPSDSKRRLKSTRKAVRRLLSLSSSSGNQKLFDPDVAEGYLPDPSKLPREEPQSTLEFTQSRLKNLPRKGAPGGDGYRKGKSHTAQVSSTILPRNFVLQHGSAKSEELLLNAFSRTPGTLQTHSHHGHGHRHHGHARRGHHSYRNQPTLTRVTENRRYLMFTKASPFRSPNDYLQTRGKGLCESETYSVLFKHTTCYELMPESAKLVTLDSQLPVGKAFRALCVNGIRAAPVWDSASQSFTGILTINDFLQMLNYWWRSTPASGSPAFKVEDSESIPICQWRELCAEADAQKASSSSKASEADGNSTLTGETSLEHSASADSISQNRCSHRSVSESSSGGDVFSAAEGEADTNSIVSAPSQLDYPSVRGVNTTDTASGSHSMGGLTVIHPDDTLFTALRLLAKAKLHRLPVFDDTYNGTGNPLFVLTHRSLLAYLYRKQVDLPRPQYLQVGLREAGVGTYENLALVTPFTKLVDALTHFEGERVSALPVVDSLTSRRLLDIFAKFDVITLILAGMYKKPDMTVQNVLDICKQIHRGVIPSMPVPPEGPSKFAVETCLSTDTIQYALTKLMQTGYHRLIIIDNQQNCRVEGVVSISDLLYFMVLRKEPSRGVAFTVPKEPSLTSETSAFEWLFCPEKASIATGLKEAISVVSEEQNSTDEDGRNHLPQVQTLTQIEGQDEDSMCTRNQNRKEKLSKRLQLRPASSSGSSSRRTRSSSNSSDYSSHLSSSGSSSPGSSSASSSVSTSPSVESLGDDQRASRHQQLTQLPKLSP